MIEHEDEMTDIWREVVEPDSVIAKIAQIRSLLDRPSQILEPDNVGLERCRSVERHFGRCGQPGGEQKAGGGNGPEPEQRYRTNLHHRLGT